MVDLAAMPDSDDDDEQNVIHDPIDDSVVADANPVEAVLACQLEGVLGTRIFNKAPQAGGDPLLNRPGKLANLTSCGR
jgi:hypothetical protein